MTRTLLLMVGIVLAALYFAAAGPFWKLTPDSVTYVLAAQSLAEGGGYGVAGRAVTLYPPGTSMAMAIAWALAPGSYRLLNAQQAVAAVASAGLVFLLFRGRLGTTGAGAAAVMLLGSTLLFDRSTFLLSDVLFLFFSLLAFVLHQRSRGLAAALAAAVAGSIRILGGLIAVGILLDYLIQWRQRRERNKLAAVAMLGVLLCVGMWEVRNARRSWSFAELALQNEPWIKESGRVNVLRLAQRLAGNLPEYRFIGELLANLPLQDYSWWLRWCYGITLGALAALGLWQLFRSGVWSEVFYVALFLLAISLYHPWIEIRWFLPLTPWLYFSLVAGWQRLASSFPGRWVSVPAVLFLAYYLAAGAVHAVRQIPQAHRSPFAPSPFLNYGNLDLQRLAIWLDGNSDSGVRIVCHIPRLVELLVRRPSVGYLPTTDRSRQIEYLRAAGVRYALLDLRGDLDRRFLLPALEGNPQARLLRAEPMARLYELTPP